MPQVCRIEYIRTQGRVITTVGGSDSDGQPWLQPVGEVISRIKRNELICYVTLEGQSHLVTIAADRNGAEYLRTFLGDAEELLSLPRGG
jgi:hypothetical protein